MHRRRALGILGVSLTSPLAIAASAAAQAHPAAGPMPSAAAAAPQAPALHAPDPAPQQNDIEKYPRCSYCGMDRRRFHHSRMLIHYGDGTVDPLCSLRCAVNSLALHLGAVPVAIWVGDNAATTDPLPLADAEKATYLVRSSIRGVMTRRSKVAYSTADAAAKAMAASGGEIADFDKALAAAFGDVAESISRYLKTNEERLKRIAKQGDR